MCLDLFTNLSILNKLRNIIRGELGNVVGALSGSSGTLLVKRFSESLQVSESIRAQLVDDAGQELLQLLSLSVSADDEGVGGHGDLSLRLLEMDDGSILVEKVDLIDARDLVETHLAQGDLELLVVASSLLVDSLSLSANGALASDTDLVLHAVQLFLVHGVTRSV